MEEVRYLQLTTYFLHLNKGIYLLHPNGVMFLSSSCHYCSVCFFPMQIHDQHVLQLLKTHFGYDSFRSPQDEIVRSIFAGRDTFVLLPTGAGKSLCYQFPAVALPGLTIVISPLIALMKDQVDHLRAHGISAGCINSTMTRAELQAVARAVIHGKLKLLYLAPERLSVPRFRAWLIRQDISLIAIDEAHCISEWGHDFRPEYRQLASLREDVSHVPIVALTASAIPQAKQDIIQQLQLKDCAVFQTTFNRPNLHYVIRPADDRWAETVEWIKKYDNDSVVIYCLSRKNTQELAADLQRVGIRAQAYHAGLPAEQRAMIQDDFARDRIQVVVATIAFGMGIDKPNIRLVIHYNLPKSMEGYYQETGRAGRDGVLSHCVLFVDLTSVSVYERFLAKMQDGQARSIARQKLDQMVAYATSGKCRRNALLTYFDEHYPEKNCQSCDVCLPEYHPRSLSGSLRTEQTFHPVVFEELRTLRAHLARAEDVPPFVIFSDHSLQEMSRYLPLTPEAFLSISGVGKHKLEKYGEAFTAILQSLVKKYGVQPLEKTKPPRMHKVVHLRPSSTYALTLDLLQQGFSIAEIAARREITEQTVLTHLEKLLDKGHSLNLTHLREDIPHFREIQAAFRLKGLARLSPVKEVLGDAYEYDQLRLVRLVMLAEE